MTAAVCMMLKVPRPSAVKTRMCPPLSYEQAARLATAFALDTWRAVHSVPDVHPVLMYAGSRASLPTVLSVVDDMVAQCEGDLGARIEHAARTGLARANVALVIGSDAPALPPALIAAARACLTEADAVLAPVLDGGFCLLGLRRLCAEGLLAELSWSVATTCAATRARLVEHGYRVAVLPPWFDVDAADDLTLLRHAIAADVIDAPATSRMLARLPVGRLR